MSMRMWITRKRWLFVGAVVAVLLMGVPVFAASDTFKEKATEFYQRHCTRGRATSIIAVLCYTFDKTGELNADLNKLAERVQGLEARQEDADETLATHETRLQVLEAALHTHPPTQPSNCASAVSSQPIVVDDFNSHTDGSIVGQGGWQSYVNGDHFVVQGDIVFEGTKAVHNNSFGDSGVGKQGTPRADGQQAVCFRTENRDSWGFYSADGNVGFRVSQGFNGTTFASVSLKKDGHVAYYDPVADVYSDFATYNDNEWTLLEIEWRSSDKKARYRVNAGTWTDWKAFREIAPFTHFDHANLAFVLPSGSGGVYFDTLK